MLRKQLLPRKTPDLFSLKGTTTVITGAGGGLGITLARAVLEAGGNVAGLDILGEPSAQEWRTLQRIAKTKALWLSYYQCDITDEDAMQRVFDLVSDGGQQRRAPLAGTVACAGIQQKLPALEYPKQDFECILRINVTGAFVTAKCAAKKMLEHDTRGSIVMVASMSGNIANRVGATIRCLAASNANTFYRGLPAQLTTRASPRCSRCVGR